MRQPDGKALSWSISADVEALTWNPSQPTCFLVSSEDGLVVAFDARKGAGGWLLLWAGQCLTYSPSTTFVGVPALIHSMGDGGLQL